MTEQKPGRNNLLFQTLASFRFLAKIGCGLMLLIGLPLLAQDNFVLVTAPSKVQDVCGRHGLTQLTQGSSHGIFLVSTSSVDPSISTDSDVQSFESNRALGLPELSGATVANLTQSSTSILDGLPGRTVVNYFGSAVPSNYVIQPATAIIRQHDLQVASGFTGKAVTVAVIDTGVDSSHPALSQVLVAGYNFINEA